jgi:hypothetical protein
LQHWNFLKRGGKPQKQWALRLGFSLWFSAGKLYLDIYFFGTIIHKSVTSTQLKTMLLSFLK